MCFSFYQSDLDTEALMSFLQQPVLDDCGDPMTTIDPSEFFLSEAPQKDHQHDHQYCRSPNPTDNRASLHSDGGLLFDGPYSPAFSDTKSASDSPFSGETSPEYSDQRSPESDVSCLSDTQIHKQNGLADSPLGGGVEDLNFMDFETLDPSSLLAEDDFLHSLTADSLAVNLGRYTRPRFIYFHMLQYTHLWYIMENIRWRMSLVFSWSKS